MAWFWHFLNQHGTGAADSEGIRPETDTGNGWEAINWVSTWWGIVGRGPGSNLSQSQSHPLSESGCFLSNRSQYRLNIARTLNKDQKKSKKKKDSNLLSVLIFTHVYAFHDRCNRIQFAKYIYSLELLMRSNYYITSWIKSCSPTANLTDIFFGPCFMSELCQTGAVIAWTRNSQTLREGGFGSAWDSNRWPPPHLADKLVWSIQDERTARN